MNGIGFHIDSFSSMYIKLCDLHEFPFQLRMNFQHPNVHQMFDYCPEHVGQIFTPFQKLTVYTIPGRFSNSYENLTAITVSFFNCLLEILEISRMFHYRQYFSQYGLQIFKTEFLVFALFFRTATSSWTQNKN